MKLAISYSTKDRVDLSRQTHKPLLHGAMKGDFDLFWVDGSVTTEGESYAHEVGYPAAVVEHNVRGGADAAIVYALTRMLKHEAGYEVVGLVENDVLLHDDWLGPTLSLFDRASSEGLEVGAVSPRAYEDRILIQRDGYAVMHNVGAGVVLFSREAAKLILANYRTGWTLHNRRIFNQLSGVDIGRYWCFKGGQHPITADWHFDTILAEYGLASLALTPSPVEMIGQSPSLEDQGLKLSTEPVEWLRDDKAFAIFVERMRSIREDKWWCGHSPVGRFTADDGTHTIFAHQVERMGGKFIGDWRLKWSQGHGPFAYKAGEINKIAPALTIPMSGPGSFLVSGGKEGGKVLVEDPVSGYRVDPQLPVDGDNISVMQIFVPAAVSYREVTLTALTPGIVFYAMHTHEPQPWLPNVTFDWSKLPPV